MNVTVKESSLALTKKEKMMYCDGEFAQKMDDLLQAPEDRLVIHPKDYILLEIETDDGSSFEKVVVLDKDGSAYTTSSKAFIERFIDIFKDLNADGEEFEYTAMKRPSTNFKGKFYITGKITG